MLPPTEERGRRDEIIRRLATRGESQARSARQRWRHHAHNHWLAEQPLISYDLSGALLAVRRDAWENTGPFDEGFKLYFEETDWLMRLKRKGLKAVYVPEAEAVHFYNQSAAREVVGSAQQASRALLDSGDGLGREELGFNPCDGEVVQQVVLHLIEVDTFEVASGYDAGGKRQGRAVLQKVEQIVLTGQDHGQIGLRVGLELADGVQFGEHIKP